MPEDRRNVCLVSPGVVTFINIKKAKNTKLISSLRLFVITLHKIGLF